MNSADIRKTFLEFFKSKKHEIVPSAPMVIKNDPTLMFTNAGMNQFKDIFLGNAPAKYKRIANTQKCLRVSGKHNDLEEVGVDTYHHTMFEMLGNWSFGDYFKEEAIAWAWELLTEVYKIPQHKLYVTVFEGSKEENLAFDQESFDYWKKYIAEDRILKGSKKDNFWEMGDTGPCGPCTEIHVDIRPEEEKKKEDGKNLVNAGHPQVIEIWNLVFMEFNRKANGSLEKLPAKHVDTGMGFERLCMVLQGKTSNYDTDVFQPIIQYLEQKSSRNYGLLENEKYNIAMRVIADHIRAIAFAIADGQLPSNNKAGYVIRRILRRAVRYGYSFLDFKEPFLYQLVSILVKQMGDFFQELKAQEELIKNIIKEEESAFLRTLERGLTKLSAYMTMGELSDKHNKKIIKGDLAFELYGTDGFPIDLTELIARENNWTVDIEGFNKLLEEEKQRARDAASVEAQDWIILKQQEETQFVGYDNLETQAQILRYRKIESKGKEQYQLVLNRTPFYAESGGQVGDTGILVSQEEKIKITNTKKENGLIVHYTDQLPKNAATIFTAQVNKQNRIATQNNHSATHLLHAALRQVLGKHVEQKGSLVNEEYLRFDFSHFSKVTEEEIKKIEQLVNQKIRENISLKVKALPIEEAKKMGAMALFGEKYGEMVRVVIFDDDYSIELCGGTHVPATGQIGVFKIISESSVAAGIRRIEAITATKAEIFINKQLEILQELKILLKNPKDLVKNVQELSEENILLNKQLQELLGEKATIIKATLRGKIQSINGINFIAEKIDMQSVEIIKDISFQLKNEVPDLFLVLASEVQGKANLSVMIAENLVKEKSLNANTIVREIAKEIKGGGGGQPFYATAGGTDTKGLYKALEKAKKFL